MNWRLAEEPDLAECLELQPSHIGDEVIGRSRALVAWKKLLSSSSFNGVVIEVKGAASSRPVVGFGSSLFVSTAFAERELANRSPGLNGRIITSVDAGESIALSEGDLRRRNTSGDLYLVILYAIWRQNGLTADQIAEAQLHLAVSFMELHQGYRFRLLLSELIDHVDREFARSTGIWRVVPPLNPSLDRHHPVKSEVERSLAVMTRESSVSVPGSMATTLFGVPKPSLRLRRSDQQLLWHALEGLTDEELANRLELSMAAVKKRWVSIFDQARLSRPNLFPETRMDGVRGRQVRHHLLAYLRTHREELRPFDWSRRDSPERPPEAGAARREP